MIPYSIANALVEWSEAGDVVRFIITDTPVNFPILLGPVRYGEQDGTGDVYVTLTMRRYRALTAESLEIKAETGNNYRAPERAQQATRVHTVAKSDTLWGIARKFSGNGSLCQTLAKYNVIKNPNLIYIGQQVACPDLSQL